MQIAILVVLILILLVLAPWILGVIAFVAAGLGVVGLFVGGVMAAGFVCCLGYLAFNGELFGTKAWRAARRMRKLTEKSNRRYRENNPE